MSVGKERGQDHVDQPQANHEDAGGDLGAVGTAQLCVAEEGEVASENEEHDSADGTSCVDGHAEGERAGGNVELAVLKSKISKINFWLDKFSMENHTSKKSLQNPNKSTYFFGVGNMTP